MTCVWNASKQLCSSPEKPKPWVRNIVRTLLVVFTIVVLILILALQKDIVNAIKPYPQLAWLLTIPNGILTILKKTKEDLKITTLVIENSDHEAVGILHLHDILKAGVV